MFLFAKEVCKSISQYHFERKIFLLEMCVFWIVFYSQITVFTWSFSCYKILQNLKTAKLYYSFLLFVLNISMCFLGHKGLIGLRCNIFFRILFYKRFNYEWNANIDIFMNVMHSVNLYKHAFKEQNK